MENPTLGEQELDVLQLIAEQAPVAARQVAERYSEEKGVAHSTVYTVMERLRKKGYLKRRKSEGVFRYTLRMPQAEVLHGVVHQFVQNMLGGSIAPVAAYLVKTRQLSAEELAEFERMVAELKAERQSGSE